MHEDGTNWNLFVACVDFTYLSLTTFPSLAPASINPESMASALYLVVGGCLASGLFPSTVRGNKRKTDAEDEDISSSINTLCMRPRGCVQQHFSRLQIGLPSVLFKITPPSNVLSQRLCSSQISDPANGLGWTPYIFPLRKLLT